MSSSSLGDFLFYRPQRSYGKVMFSQACVKNSVHRGGAWQGHRVWCGGMHGRVCAWWGACMAGGMHGGGHVCGEGHAWQWGGGACVAGETAIAAGGTHPTGMPSCFNYKNFQKLHFLTLSI